jgi:choline-sulfatase
MFQEMIRPTSVRFLCAPATLLVVCLLTSSANLVGQNTNGKGDPPDVFLITIDTLRADHVHCYGYNEIHTPALDSLAKDGIRFEKAFTPAPITNTSHASILTGLQPSSHGVTDFAIPLAASHPTWAELLKTRQYQTAAFIGAIILDSRVLAPGFDRGFDFYDNFPESPRSKLRWGRVERRAMDVVTRAESWLTTNSTGLRFVWVHLYDPHDPYEPPPPFSQTYKDHLYDGEIAYTDFALQHFLNFLKARGWYRNSLLIVTGDHGEGLGEHNEQTHGIFLYDSTTRVPLILKLPGNTAAGKVIDSQVRTTDILPTALDLLKIPAPEVLDGMSLTPLFAATETSQRVVYEETDYPLRFGWAPLHAVRADGFKFIEAPRPELYNLQADPGELNNTYQPWNPAVKNLRAMLADSRMRMPSQPSASSVGSQTLAELNALGYFGNADAKSSTNVPEPSLLPDPKDKIEEQNLLHTAMIAAEDDREADAEITLAKVLQLDPESFVALRQLGELELQAGMDSRAAEYLTRAHKIRPQDSATAFDAGRALEKTGDLVSAQEALESSLKSDPKQLPAHLLLGQVYLGLGNAVAAEDQFQAALLLQPASFEAELELARAKIGAGKSPAAVQDLELLAKSHPHDPKIFDLLAQAYQTAGDSKRAQSAANRAQLLRHAPTNKP